MPTVGNTCATSSTLLTMRETESRPPSDAAITATVQAVSSSYIQEAWQKALERRATDAEGAITAARTLLESVCKHSQFSVTGMLYTCRPDLAGFINPDNSGLVVIE